MCIVKVISKDCFTVYFDSNEDLYFFKFTDSFGNSLTSEDYTEKDSKPAQVDISVGDTVWYQGEKWVVRLHDYWCDCSATDVHKFYLVSDSKHVAGVDLWEIKKVVRTDSHTDHAT